MESNIIRDLQVAADRTRGVYHSPRLNLLGDIRSLTEAGSANRVEQDIDCTDNIGNVSRAMC